MKKSKSIGVVLLFAFMGILAMPLLSAPAAPCDDHDSNLIFFENGDDHTSQWLIRSISDSEEFNNRTAATNSLIVLYGSFISYHSNIQKVRFTQTKERKDIQLPKERIYLSNSCFTI
jgi:hypothetical protein